MGRAFEFRKERKFKRWGNMARVFTRLGKEITIAAKSGPDPATNPKLRTLILFCKVIISQLCNSMQGKKIKVNKQNL